MSEKLEESIVSSKLKKELLPTTICGIVDY